MVKRGQRLITIGRSGAAAAQVTAAAESLKEQEAELNRVKILVQSGAIPGSQLDSARAKFEGARALLAKARESAGDYSVEAPWDGVISKVLVKDGDFVAPRTPLVEMYDPASLVIRFAVPEAQATEVFKGMPLNVHLDAHPNKDFQGKISRVYPDLDTKSRTRTVEAELDYPLALIPGHVCPPQVASANRGRSHRRPPGSSPRHPRRRTHRFCYQRRESPAPQARNRH